MKAQTRHTNDVAVIDLQGRLVSGVGDVLLRDTVNQLLADGHKKILLNLTGVTHIDSSGVGELVASRRICQRFGGSLKFVRGGEAVERVLDIARILPLFSFYEDVEEGLLAFDENEQSSDDIFRERA